MRPQCAQPTQSNQRTLVCSISECPLYPQSGHQRELLSCPLSANNGHRRNRVTDATSKKTTYGGRGRRFSAVARWRTLAIKPSCPDAAQNVEQMPPPLDMRNGSFGSNRTSSRLYQSSAAMNSRKLYKARHVLLTGRWHREAVSECGSCAMRKNIQFGCVLSRPCRR